jgi:hypothetical protein
MRRWWTLVVVLALHAAPAQAVSMFSADATFNFDDATKFTANTPGTLGTGGYGSASPLTVTASSSDPNVPTIDGHFSRIGQVPPGNVDAKFDVRKLGSGFPASWGGTNGGAITPFFETGVTGTTGSGNGTGCSDLNQSACTAFFAEFSHLIDSASLDFFDLQPTEIDLIEVRAFGGTDPEGVATPIEGAAYISGDPNRPLTVTKDGATNTLRVCSGANASQCSGLSTTDFIRMQIFAENDEIFRSILFRGFGAFNGDAAQASNSNSVMVDNIAVGTGIPEPGTLALFGFGATAVFGLARLRRE